MKETSNKGNLLVIGMARSGTTLVTDILAKSENFHVEIEPHALWKSGNFKYLNDEEYDISDDTVNYIRKQIFEAAEGKRVLEKSPINCLRPELVYRTFPEVKVVYMLRDPIGCIRSNYVRSLKNDSFRPSITLRKYFIKGGTEDLPYATSKRTLFSQVRLTDFFYLFRYVLLMVIWRNADKEFPFGTKLKDFRTISKQSGLIRYHLEVLKRSYELIPVFKKLYGNKIKFFSLEKLMTDKEELKRLFRFSEVNYSDASINQLISDIDVERKEKAIQKSGFDDEIIAEMKNMNFNFETMEDSEHVE